MKSPVFIAVIVVFIAVSATLLKTGEVEKGLKIAADAVSYDPCLNVNTRFRVKTEQDSVNLVGATQNMVRYSKFIVVESLTLTKDSISMALDVAIQSI